MTGLVSHAQFPEPVDYIVARPSDAEETIRLLATVFSESEPPAVAMGLSCGDMEQFLQLLAPKAIADGLTPHFRFESEELSL